MRQKQLHSGKLWNLQPSRLPRKLPMKSLLRTALHSRRRSMASFRRRLQTRKTTIRTGGSARRTVRCRKRSWRIFLRMRWKRILPKKKRKTRRNLQKENLQKRNPQKKTPAKKNLQIKNHQKKNLLIKNLLIKSLQKKRNHLKRNHRKTKEV